MRDWFAKIALILAFAAPAAAQLLIPGLSLQGRIIAYASLFLLLVPIALVAIRHVPPRTVVAESGFGWRHEIGASLRSEEHTSELQSLMRISYAVFCLKKKKKQATDKTNDHETTHEAFMHSEY